MIIAITIYSIILTAYIALVLMAGGACNSESKKLERKYVDGTLTENKFPPRRR